MTIEIQKTANLREGTDIPEPIVRAEVKPNPADSIKDLASQAFAGKPDLQSQYAEKIKAQLLSHAKNYFNVSSDSDQSALERYWSFVQTKTDAKRIQIVHNPENKTIAVAFLSENGTDITDSVLHKLYLERKIESPNETRSQLAELSRQIIPPTGSTTKNPYQKN